MAKNRILLAIVGMPGSGKSETVSYIQRKGIPFIRFGDLTEEELARQGLPVTPDNEQMMREKLRKDLSMAAYAIKAEQKIQALSKDHQVIIIDGLYSWEEYVYLKQKFPQLLLIALYTEPQIRYQRLSQRTVRPFSLQEARKRDIAEIENLNKGGTIAIADYLITNGGDIASLHQKIDALLVCLRIKGVL